jgi:hypothetical protein
MNNLRLLTTLIVPEGAHPPLRRSALSYLLAALLFLLTPAWYEASDLAVFNGGIPVPTKPYQINTVNVHFPDTPKTETVARP